MSQQGTNFEANCRANESLFRANLEYKVIDKDFTAKTLLEKVKNPTNPKTVKEVFDIQIKRLHDAKQYPYAQN